MSYTLGSDFRSTTTQCKEVRISDKANAGSTISWWGPRYSYGTNRIITYLLVHLIFP